jgi:hypothetical protein
MTRRPAAGELRGRIAAAIDELDIGQVDVARAILDDLLVDLEPRRRGNTVPPRSQPPPAPADTWATYRGLTAVNAVLGLRPPRPPDELREAA